MKPVLVHTTDSRNSDWHVYFGLLVDEWREEIGDEMRTRAFIMMVDGTSVRFERLEHIDSLISASYYVQWRECGRMLDDVSADVEKRGLWRERLTELRQILDAFQPSI